ncbi:Tyrosine recombinase XerC [uncultured Clostridium sp.]|nr:Tyrosine recombinase XerC [uncultured Clostridium sp.]
MTGRIEHKQQIEAELKEKIRNYPSWIDEYYYSLTNNTHTTKVDYLSMICRFLDSYFKSHDKRNESIANISGVDINRYLDDIKNDRLIKTGRELSKATIALQITSLTSFFDFLVTQGYMPENPMSKAVKRPKSSQMKPVVYLENNEIHKVLQNIEKGVGTQKAIATQKKWKNRDKLLVLFPLATGMRVTALDEINVTDIDFVAGTVSVIEKREKRREFDISGLMEILEAWLEDREKILEGLEMDALFISKTRGGYSRLTVRAINMIVKRYTAGINKNISPHKLRATYGTQFYRQTKDIYLTANMMGHNSTNTTARYVVADKKVKEAESKKYMEKLTKMIDR